MSTTPAGRLLAAIFADARAAELFTVLRNGERLPHALAGRDLDVSTTPGHVPADVCAFLTERGRAAGWTAACISPRPHMTAFSLVTPAADGAEPDAIHFDVFAGITFACIPLVPPAILAGESVVRDGVRMLGVRGRVLATLAHHLAWNGGLTKPKYRAELRGVLEIPADRAWLLARLRDLFGVEIAHEACDPDRLGDDLDRRRRAVRMALLARNARAAPFETARAIARYSFGQLPSFARPPGLVARSGELLADGGAPVDLSLACRIAPHGFAIDDVRSRAGARTRNGERYERTLARTWKRATLVRWLAPSLFLWYQAKRGRVVVVERLPLGLRLLRRFARPAWLGRPVARTAAAGATIRASPV
jgi:hypothetical protein